MQQQKAALKLQDSGWLAQVSQVSLPSPKKWPISLATTSVYPTRQEGQLLDSQRDYGDTVLPQVDKSYIPLEIPDQTNQMSQNKSWKETLVNSPRVSSLLRFCLGPSGTGFERDT